VTSLIDSHAAVDLAALRTFFEGFPGPESLLASLEEAYVRLFINDRGGIVASLYASSYENEKTPQLMGEAAVRMQKTLSDLDIHISDAVREPPDHLSIELEVLYFLLSRIRGTDPADALTAAADFAAGEMLPWIQVFHRRLADEVRCPFYPLITSVLLSVLQVIVMLPEISAAPRQI
jgi:TorA-specific chaperone